MIEGLDQRFTDSIMAEGCATPRLFLERTLARLPPTLGYIFFAAMIACYQLPIRFEKQSPEGTLSVALVFCFRVRSYYSAHQFVVKFNRRFDSRPIAERLNLLRTDSAQTQCRECSSIVHRRVELASLPTHFDEAIPAVKLECRLPLTHPDPNPLLRDSKLSFFLVCCAVLCRCTSLVRLADRSPGVV